MSNILSNMKSFCMLTILSIAGICSTDVLAANTGSEDAFHIVYHDDYGNIIRRDAGVSGYEFDAEDPFFFVALPISNIAWCSTFIEERGQIPFGAKVYNTGDKLEDDLTEDIHLYPITAYGTFVRFNSQGGTPVHYQFVHVGQHAERPADGSVVKTGYTFAGWYDNAACTGSEFDFTTWTPIKTDSEDPDKEITLYAKWTPLQVDYKINVWLEKADHPVRTSLEDAQAHMFEDYIYGTTITKSGYSGDKNVEFTSADRSSNALKNLTYFNNDRTKFPIYFYDEKYGSYAQQLSEASIAEINDGAGIDPTGKTNINVFYRRLVFKVEVGVRNGTDAYTSGWDGNYQHFQVLQRDGESIGKAIARSGQSLNTATTGILSTPTLTPNFNYKSHFVFGNYTQKKGYASDTYGNGGLLGDEFSGIISREYYDFYGSSIVDEAFAALLYIKFDKSNLHYTFIRNYYFQTVESAKAGNEQYSTTSFNPNMGHYMKDDTYSYQYKMGNETDGFINWEEDGYRYWFCWCVKRDGSSVTRSTKNNNLPTTELGGVGPYECYQQDGHDPRGFKLEVFYLRKAYKIEFETKTTKMTVKDDDAFDNVFFEQPLSDIFDKIKTADGNGYVIGTTTYQEDNQTVMIFKGWFDNQACAGDPVDFSNMTMPAHDLILYAKWEEKQITVTFDADGGTIQGQSSISMNISSGMIPSMADEPIPAEEDLGRIEFFSWTIDGRYYDFSEPLYSNTTLIALYNASPEEPLKITYTPGAGQGEDVVEFADYGYLYNANAKVQSFFPSWSTPSRKIFKHWTDGTNTYKAGSTLIVKNDVTLTAVYGGSNANIIISREGLSAGESAIYAVYSGTGSEKTLVMNVVLTGTTSGTPAKVSRTLVDLAPGTYTVEETDWNWAYDKGTTTVKKGVEENASDTDGIGSGTITYDETIEFIFTGSAKTEVVRHGEQSKTNMLGNLLL